MNDVPIKFSKSENTLMQKFAEPEIIQLRRKNKNLERLNQELEKANYAVLVENSRLRTQVAIKAATESDVLEAQARIKALEKLLFNAQQRLLGQEILERKAS